MPQSIVGPRAQPFCKAGGSESLLGLELQSSLEWPGAGTALPREQPALDSCLCPT